MRRKWFYRLLLSYTPLFLLFVLVLFGIFYYKWTEETKERIRNTDLLLATHVMNVVESSLKEIDKTIIQQMLTDEYIQAYYASDSRAEPLQAYQIQQKLNDIKNLFPLTGEVYIYKQSSNQIITGTSAFQLPDFADAAFVQSALTGATGGSWTQPRLYKPFQDNNQPTLVVSLARPVPITSVTPRGVVVVNVSFNSIADLLKAAETGNNNAVDLRNAAGESLLLSNEPAAKPADVLPWSVSAAPSSYTGWRVVVGIPSAAAGNVMSVFFDAWTLLLLGTILLSVIVLTYITHRNYKPIEEIVMRINQYTLQRSMEIGKQPDHDEFQFISSALDNLVENSHRYEEQHNEDLHIRKKYWFYELLDGNFSLTPHEWETEAAQLLLPVKFQSTIVIVAEIDNYEHFRSVYSLRDQTLFKFVISNVVKEIGSNQAIPVWAEWKEADQFCALLYLRGSESLTVVEDIVRETQGWVAQNLKFTISVYIGTEANDEEEISQSYQDAVQAGQYRMLHGYNKVYYAKETKTILQGDLYPHLQAVRHVVKLIRSADPAWEPGYDELFARMKAEELSREKVQQIIHYLLYALDKEMNELPEDLIAGWAAHLSSDALEPILSKELLLDMQQALKVRIDSLLNPIQQWQQDHVDHHQLIDQVKQHLETNYSNPDLSLSYLSEQFGLPSRVVSKLFKSITGERFVDYLMQLRMSQAKRLLTETDEPVQAISEKVGYLQVISFIRTFKKCEGVTPGEYRKLAESASRPK